MIPAIVLGHGVTALGVTRALGRRGVPLYVAPTDNADMERWSRWYRPAPGTWVAGDLAASLRATPLSQAVLVPCSDHAAIAVANLPADLRDRFKSCSPVPGVLEELLDKGRLSVLLEQNRIDHARTWRVETERELESLDDDQLRSVFIKPRDTQRFHARYGVKSMSPSGRDAIWKTLDRLRGEGLEVVLQEYVPGPPTHSYLLEGFVDGGGTVRAVLARQRLRMHPPNFGNSSAARSIPPEEAAPAEQALRRLLHAVRYRGIFNMEFKKDARDGSFRLLDVNPRAWWHVEFAARCGVDVVHMAYRDALGLSVDSVESYEIGRTVIYPYYDLFACYRAWKSGETGLGACVRSWVGADQMIFARDDPRPFFGATLRLWVNYARRRLPGFTEAGMDHTGTSSPGQ